MFKVGDRVKVIREGYGCNYDDISSEVTITAIGRYWDETGYRVTPAIGNTESGFADGYIGGQSFEMVEDTSKYHPHYDLIIAWAKGSEIEYQDPATGNWHPYRPHFCSHYDLRIKPYNPNADRINNIEKELRRLADELKSLRDTGGDV